MSKRDREFLERSNIRMHVDEALHQAQLRELMQAQKPPATPIERLVVQIIKLLAGLIVIWVLIEIGAWIERTSLYW